MESTTKFMLKHFSNAIIEMDVPGLIIILNIAYGWGSPYAIAPLAIGVVALAFFVYYESHLATSPVVPFKLFKSRNFSSLCYRRTILLYFERCILF
ncbi:hypothetical protein BX661DRAFT_188936 [Kickxella alabastrina]|uniref:uncharacterized protein n=1 Tax=Kickxella alabastrina TaxID=61397 RepID=UPI00221F7D01|nr:uncharacterized protein BX661DRAFT_188936 [Kickxella alabastrina]KAI7820750.1 hypothetical protein BX661DRAFT_188936 [Kickxella alabastrina]